MNFKIILIFIINFIFIKEIVGSSLTTYNLYVSSYGGLDSSYCGYGLNTQPCETIEGALASFKNINNPQYSQINIFIYSGTYYSSSTGPFNLYGYTINFYAMPYSQTYSSYSISNSIYFYNNYYVGPMFTVVPNGSDYISSISFNNITVLSSSMGRMNASYDNAYLISINKNSENNIVNVALNNISCPYDIQIPLINVIDFDYFYSDSPSSDWNTNQNTYYSPQYYGSVSISIESTEFSNGYVTTVSSPFVLAPKVPTSLTIKNCTISQKIVTNTLFVIGRGAFLVDNLQLQDVVISYHPIFVIQNSEVEIKNSFFNISLENTPLLVCVGCFMEYKNVNTTALYQTYSWEKDFPLLDIERSSATIMYSSTTFNGPYVQSSDQGIIYALNSDINLRMNVWTSNISYVLYSDGSNMFVYLNTYYSAGWNIFICSTNHGSVFKGDENTLQTVISSKNCGYYSSYKKTISALNFTFVGIAFVLFLAIFFVAIKAFFRCLCHHRSSKKNIDTHTYAPVCDADSSVAQVVTQQFQ